MSEDLSRLVRKAQSEHRLPSISARVVVRGETVLELSIGVANASTGAETTPDMQYRIGSITKTFTAAAVMTLVDEGKVGLDDPVGQHVPEAAGSQCQAFVEERLLGPVGLARTSWERADPAARGYFVDPFSGVLRPEAEIQRIGGLAVVGDLWSTTADLCRWGAWLAGRDAMHAVQAMADPHHWLVAHGLGLRLHRRGDRILFGHDGAMPGFLASLICSRDEDVQGAVLTNSSTHASEVVELAIALVDKAIELHPREPELWRGHEDPPAEIAELLGIWWSEGDQIVFSWRDGHLEAQIPGAPERVKPSVFEQEGPGRFRVATGRERGERLEVVRDESGAVVKLYWATYPFTRQPQLFGPGAG